jgi:hypothetical protein
MAKDPAWLRSMKAESKKLGIPMRDMLTKFDKKPTLKDKKNKTKSVSAAKGGMIKKKK